MNKYLAIYQNDSQENALFSYCDITNDDVIEAKSPVRKSKRGLKKNKKQLKDSHSFMTTIKYKKMKVNHG